MVFQQAHATVKALALDGGEAQILGGATLTVVVLNHKLREITCANIGDSEALLVHADGFETLSTSHRLDHNLDERTRVQALGHRIARAADPEGVPGGPLRAWPGGLAVTRGIGDGDCTYVSCDPSLKTVPAPERGGVLVVCTDGVWDCVKPDDVSLLLRRPPHQWHSPQQAARAIVKRARPRSGLFDDVSAVTLFFDAADPRTPSSFLTEHFKPQRAPLYRRAFVLGSVVGSVSLGEMNMDGSKMSGNEFEPYDEPYDSPDGSKHSGSAYADATPDGSKHSGSAYADAFLRAEAAAGPKEEGANAADGDRALPSHGESEEAEGRRRRRRRSHDDFELIDVTAPGVKATECMVAAADASPHAAGHEHKLPQAPLAMRPWTATAPCSAPEASEGSKSLKSLYDEIADGVDAELRLAAEKSFRMRAPAAGGNLLASPNWTPHRTGREASLDPEEMNLWKWRGDEVARSIEWESLDASLISELGQGEFATAWASELDGVPVAVKVLKPHKRNVAEAVKGMKREIMLMSMMSHPNVLRTKAIGYFKEDGVPFVALERLGTVLNKELPADPESQPFWVTWRERRAWSLLRAIDYGIQLAKALRYCHDEAVEGYRVLHRDIKPNNIGFMPPTAEARERGETLGRLVIFDFGLTCIWRKDRQWSDDGKPEREEMRRLTGECGSLRYMAPEVCNCRPYNHLSEVFSYATVLWEMVAKRRPFNNFTADIFRRALDNGARPAIDKRWPAELRALFADMWQHDPTKRPEFCEVLPRLETIYAAELVKSTRKKGKPP